MFWTLLRMDWDYLLYGTDGVGQQRRAKALAQALDAGIGLEGSPGGFQVLLRGTLVSLRGGLYAGPSDFKFQPDRLTKMAGQCLCELFLLGSCPHVLVPGIEGQPDETCLPTHENAVAG
jgi:hypothetical protein